MKNIVVIGSGGFSKQVIEIIEKVNEIKKRYNIIGVIDDNKKLLGTTVLGYKVIGDTDYIGDLSINNQIYGVIAIAEGEVRKKISRKLNNINWENLIHPNAILSKYLKIGVGNIICAGVVVNPECEIRDHCHINIGASLGHDVKMNNFITLMPGCKISGNVTIKNLSMVGTGATILQGLSIEERVDIGAGAVVTKNTEIGNIYIGVPAKRSKSKSI